MKLPRLIVITDWALDPATLLSRLAAALSLGPDVGVLHRHPGALGRRLLDEAHRVTELAARFGNPVFVSGRLDVALLCSAHLHLPSRGLAVADVRPNLPPGRWVSRSVHDAAEGKAATGADLALVAPLFPAGSKVGDARPPLGARGFFELARDLPCPAYALGGIGPANAALVAGARGAAAISSVLHAADPKAAAAAILAAL